MIEEIKNIEKVVFARQYPFFRLLHENGTVIVPPKRHKKNSEGYIQHWNFIKHKLVNELPVGKYNFQAFYDVARKTVSDYWIDKKENYETPTVILNDIKSSTNSKTEKENMAYEKDMIDLIKENERLKAERSVLIIELENARQKYAELENELLDMEEMGDSNQGGVNGGMAALAPLVPMLEKLLEQSDKRLNLEELKIKRSIPKNLKPLVKVKQQEQQNNNTQNEYQQTLNYFDNLLNQNEEQANAELDQLQVMNVELYNQLIKDLNLEENGNETDNQ